jgi:hypothetical protein
MNRTPAGPSQAATRWPTRRQRDDFVRLAATAAVFTAALAVIMPALRVPAHVDRVAVDNPYPWRVNVIATGGDRDAWHDLGAVDRGDEQEFRELIDQGESWTFRFWYAGQHADLHITAAQLEEVGWSVAVPDELATRLRGAGVGETPR